MNNTFEMACKWYNILLLVIKPKNENNCSINLAEELLLGLPERHPALSEGVMFLIIIIIENALSEEN